MTLNTYSWTDAVVECNDEGSVLSTLKTVPENRWVYEYFRSKGQTNTGIWIGMSDVSKEGDFQWVDGSGNVSAFSYWATGQPDNSGGVENCGSIWLNNQGKWNDAPCATSYPGLCKWTNGVVSVPEGND